MNNLLYTIEDTIRDVLQKTGPYSLDDVVQQLQHHDRSEVFPAVDRMSRDGRIVLRRDPESSEYHLSLSLSHPAHAIRLTSLPVRFCVGCGYLCDEISPEEGQAQWMDAHRMDAHQYLTKYWLSWSLLAPIEDVCPHCAHVLACAHRRIPSETATAATVTT